MDLIFGKPRATSFAGGGRNPLPRGVYLVLEWPSHLLIVRSEAEGGGAILAQDGMYDAVANLPKGKSDVAADELADDGHSYTLIVDGVAHRFVIPPTMIVTNVAPAPVETTAPPAPTQAPPTEAAPHPTASPAPTPVETAAPVAVPAVVAVNPG